VVKHACDIVEESKKRGLVAGRDPWGMAAAAIYLAGRHLNCWIPQATIALSAGVTEVTLRTRCKEIVRSLRIASVVEDEQS
ncbi:MAG: hypothetical protein QXQ81_06245, partial [Candidatus Thorarchaeota archaeon]